MLLYVWNCKSYYIDVTGTKMKINVADKVKVFLVVQNSFSKSLFPGIVQLMFQMITKQILSYKIL